MLPCSARREEGWKVSLIKLTRKSQSAASAPSSLDEFETRLKPKRAGRRNANEIIARTCSCIANHQNKEPGTLLVMSLLDKVSGELDIYIGGYVT